MDRRELKMLLDEEGFNPQRYSLEGGFPDERYCLDQLPDGSWSVYGSERGKKVAERIFPSEDEACRYLLHLLRRDPSTKR
ncbi:MAG TPA: hypothetical protein VF618_11290 [Thermoanaerobaculia bacterium]